MAISQQAIDFIIAEEDGSESYYDRTEEHWDWPGGESGPTIGVGYDCGYVTRSECRRDWDGIVSNQILDMIIEGVGKKGHAAHLFVIENRADVTVTWEQAIEQFTKRELPKWEIRMAASLPNWDLLSPDSAGALLSLGYNRGVGGFNSSLPRFREMRNIEIHMRDKRWGLIPGEIRAMRRLWPNSTDLRGRRLREAALFEEGVKECGKIQTSGLVAQSSSPPASGTAPSSSPT